MQPGNLELTLFDNQAQGIKMVEEEKSPQQLRIEDLPIQVVDSQSPIPLYYQISLDLRRMLEEHLIPPGSILPPEIEICQAYGVGRQTVRQAIARLVDDNLVDRYAGKGTFVRDHAKRASFHLDRSFSQHVRDLGMTPSSKTICQEENIVMSDVHSQLQASIGQPCLNLERVRYGDQEPICYQSTTILTQHCPGLGDHDFNQKSLYEVLAKDYGLIITRIEHLIRAVAADDYRAELLEVDPGAPLLFVTTTAYLENGEIIEVNASHYRADRYEYRTAEERCS
jgi:GntR family transcriptional regulator